MSKNTTALERAIEVAGGQTQLASKIGCSQQRIAYWLHEARKGVAPEFCMKIEEATGVTRHDLRPDIYGGAPAEQGAA